MTSIPRGPRIKDLQHTTRTLGKIRAGVYEGRPKSSETFVITSEFEHLVAAAAEMYGGLAEPYDPQGPGPTQWRVVTDEVALDALLPPGPKDPVSQHYEFWTRGGLQRRCDGQVLDRTGKRCFCKAQWGPYFLDADTGNQACQMITRVNVALPDVPDVGLFLFETHSRNAARELPAIVDLLRAAYGIDVAVPIQLLLTQRSKMIGGRVKHYQVPVLKPRHQLSFGAVAAAQIPAGPPGTPALEAGGERPALAAAPGPDYAELIRRAADREQAARIWSEAYAELRHRPDATAVLSHIKEQADVRLEELEDVGPLWEHIVARFDGTAAELNEAVEQACGHPCEHATLAELRAFAATLPPAPAAQESANASEGQVRRIHAQLRALGITTRAARLAYFQNVIGHQVDSTMALTGEQASRVLDRLEAALRDREADKAREGIDTGSGIAPPSASAPEPEPTASAEPAEADRLEANIRTEAAARGLDADALEAAFLAVTGDRLDRADEPTLDTFLARLTAGHIAPEDPA
ncbi:hypothetical protein [Bailinhaonella thermotolerans]|uniref:Uncharacterized protein n=1 Tax=Bailinhaonella thermotolerans TaxID=1070861 RepID=A0A3A4A035_9ACTN|nr:hypothetical protein [Bailinhaonella thermotolerans]RJL21078.1 hypothetical protein D5H75_38345 [Bailinhaonella thermotolerans]